MKKVYLVKVLFEFSNGNTLIVLLNIFASKKKADVYAEYKRFLIKRDGPNKAFSLCYLNAVSATINVDCESICTFDWSADLKKLQDEELSERSEANMIAEENRNIDLTKKYNLLEFV